MYISVLRAMAPCAIRNNKMTKTAESAAACLGTCDIASVNIQEVYLNAPCVFVISSLYWYLCDNNSFCLLYVFRYSWGPTSNYVRFLCFSSKFNIIFSLYTH